ncbi:urease accessory protein UreF [Novimethylophilus kurashikiensis]|uniref:Urease accessory protein UreF n=1 Tax=Novimethylophilus kurashikiensis TaxID=1825523 RepID=A0A2R5F9G0_9PROT|nr:hypothetical protein [Novimethylophilus kurashikiensis]GBG14870.1 urease accessory protein UreF [Novimethylophilus kurashikiensis]
MSKVIPIIKAETLIPVGQYCYKQGTVRGWEVGADGVERQTGLCPFWSLKSDAPGQCNGWCSYLKTGDMEEDGTTLLFDQCKECGVKDDEFGVYY